MESAGVEDSSVGFCKTPGSSSPLGQSSEGPAETGPEESPEEETPEEEEEVVGESEEERGPLRCLGLAAASCCVCVELEQVRNCVRSEKICILPILACLLSLALCTAGLKWVFVDKIFEYEPPTHLDPKRIGQDPIIIDADPTLGLPISFSQPNSPPAILPPTTATTANPGQPAVFVEGDSTAGPFAPASPKVSLFTPTSTVTIYKIPASQPLPSTTPEPDRNSAPSQHPGVESNNIITKTSATSTTPSAKTSSHVTPCSEEERAYCVNGGECFTLEVTPNSIKRLCRCPAGFSGDRCQNTEPVRLIDQKQHHGIEFMEAEELYQKRVITITGICIALLVVGIMCVVAYCKTKKQRKKLHDRLRQSLRERNAMASMANGPLHPQNSHPPPENLQLVNYALKNALPAQHVIEKETETSFSTSQYTSSTQPSTAVTHTSSHCWSNGKTDSIMSDSHAALVMLRVQNSQNGTPTQRGRLNATGGAQELLKNYLKNSRETVDSCKDSPYSERYVSTMTTPTHLSPVKLLSPATPSSPPSEMSAPLSSLATSVPSMATSPSGEEERPLLFLTPPRLREKAEQEPNRSQQLRNSAHYNHGLESPSPPPSPLHIIEDDQYESTQECNSTPAAAPASDSQSPAASHGSKRTKPAAQASQPEQEPASGGSSQGNSLESETEDERVSEDTPFLSIQNPGATSTGPLSLDGLDSSRTNPALHLSPQDDLQTRLASVMANQNPIAV
ncbi:pro-neuregulin-1, membrane-bound isoform isoform X2 [Pygocentrus nattereri]|uniref:pro-neuregulin-1, membrane-bound isoform isoform X2 n=1 Tax=Pygocentrus nattereri TaxID=42514 RepID=UPI001891644D|nr:pro-neuregulin-1, membrane-bound isoform isoform X2 [Pygocentrus nattereri]